jgi:hypothetical protein
MIQAGGDLVSAVYAAPESCVPASVVPDDAGAFEDRQSEDALASAGGILSGMAFAIVLWVLLLVPVLFLLR